MTYKKQAIPSPQTVQDHLTRNVLVAVADNVQQSNAQLVALTSTQTAQTTTLATHTSSLTTLTATVGTITAKPTPANLTGTAAAGSVTNVYTNTTFTGGIGSTAYTVADLVAILKAAGILKL